MMHTRIPPDLCRCTSCQRAIHTSPTGHASSHGALVCSRPGATVLWPGRNVAACLWPQRRQHLLPPIPYMPITALTDRSWEWPKVVEWPWEEDILLTHGSPLSNHRVLLSQPRRRLPIHFPCLSTRITPSLCKEETANQSPAVRSCNNGTLRARRPPQVRCNKSIYTGILKGGGQQGKLAQGSRQHPTGYC
jgi:hypothetical protein